jgi:hypothetical protein
LKVMHKTIRFSQVTGGVFWALILNQHTALPLRAWFATSFRNEALAIVEDGYMAQMSINAG